MKPRLRIVLPGGGGQVGNILSRYFHAQGHDVVVLARTVASAPWRVVHWDGANLGNWTSELENADVLINLAGRSVDCRYTAANRRAIKESRVQTTHLLGQAIGQSVHPPHVWMNASMVSHRRFPLME
jgi:NAD dependent epimerase/dehydratase family enzyme